MFHAILLTLLTRAGLQHDCSIPNCSKHTRRNASTDKKNCEWQQGRAAEFFLHLYSAKHHCGNTDTSIKASAREKTCLHLSTRSELLTYRSVRLNRQLPPWHFLDNLCWHLVSSCMLISNPEHQMDKTLAWWALYLKTKRQSAHTNWNIPAYISPPLITFLLCECVNVCRHKWVCVFYVCSSQLLCPLWPQMCVCLCVPVLQKNLSFPRVLFPISCQALNGWFEFTDRCWITHQCHTCLCHWWRRRGIAAQQREKQTGLQGDREDFWDWNQCAYYETGRLNRLDDEPRGWWSTVIIDKLRTLLSARKHFT